MNDSVRQYPRYRFQEFENDATLFLENQTSPIETRDLSASGISFRAPLHLDAGETVVLEISPFGQAPIRCAAQIVRSEASGPATLYGARFVTLPLLHKEKLYSLVREALFSKDLASYAKRTDLRIKQNPAEVAKFLLWAGLLVLFVFIQVRLIFDLI